ncbi:efflux RND transporter periplasmic adaptor subunit [Candidatus Berkiella aquae]|uniref:Efflux RND transporter periplasmic adaptor subunit n=1 Tax=Candidatus Berkiella aquae TaxID=295108 RepID=A0A0Q9YIE8_9GAMM|nr:efflux RND transporter periplasmic adaptor subunit [Candidatus Berkiella aquae]MCS5711714.1 efflux RND transporter periplasmic adaptor subunit [Candidatus Berkiella aquae]
MKSFSQYIKERIVMFGTVASVAISGTGAITYNKLTNHIPSPAALSTPIIPVSVHTVNQQNVRIWSSFSGRMRAIDYAEIRPEVSGRIVQILFNDGQIVNTGDVLMIIDPLPYEAAVAKAQASLASAKTKAEFAKKELERALNLVKTHAIAERLYDESANQNRVAEAEVKSAEAELKQAKINLDRAYVKAPISGRVSRAEITLGNLVQTGQNAPVLTSIVSKDGIYADFEVDEQTYMKSIRSQAATQHEEQAIPVELTIPGDEDHPYKGSIYTFDNHIDTGSGTIRARAKFANEDGRLMPGMFVSVKLGSSKQENVLLIPERAIGNDQNKRFVYVVNQDNKVVYREVNLGKQAENGTRIVLSGLQPGDRVIVDGLQHVRPDVVVQTKETDLTLQRNDAKEMATN